jgi:uncharacterized protein YjiS (DUF1127 family)
MVLITDLDVVSTYKHSDERILPSDSGARLALFFEGGFIAYLVPRSILCFATSGARRRSLMRDPMTYFVERPAVCHTAEARTNRLSNLLTWVLARRPGRLSAERLSGHLLRDIGLDEPDRGLGRRHR